MNKSNQVYFKVILTLNLNVSFLQMRPTLTWLMESTWVRHSHGLSLHLVMWCGEHISTPATSKQPPPPEESNRREWMSRCVPSWFPSDLPSLEEDVLQEEETVVHVLLAQQQHSVLPVRGGGSVPAPPAGEPPPHHPRRWETPSPTRMQFFQNI